MNRILTVAHYLPLDIIESVLNPNWQENLFSFPLSSWIQDNKKFLQEHSNREFFNVMLLSHSEHQKEFTSNDFFHLVYDENSNVKGLIFLSPQQVNLNVNEPMSFIENNNSWFFSASPLFEAIYPCSGYQCFDPISQIQTKLSYQDVVVKCIKLLQTNSPSKKDYQTLCENFHFFPNSDPVIMCLMTIMNVSNPNISFDNFSKYWQPYIIQGFINN